LRPQPPRPSPNPGPGAVPPLQASSHLPVLSSRRQLRHLGAFGVSPSDFFDSTRGTPAWRRWSPCACAPALITSSSALLASLPLRGPRAHVAAATDATCSSQLGVLPCCWSVVNADHVAPSQARAPEVRTGSLLALAFAHDLALARGRLRGTANAAPNAAGTGAERHSVWPGHPTSGRGPREEATGSETENGSSRTKTGCPPNRCKSRR
jgi:hypothetical protein